MIDRIALPGEQIALRARFLDETGTPVTATNVTVSIFEPGKDTTDPLQAIVSNAPATSLGQGIYEYIYTVPTTATVGAWADVWSGDLVSQTLSATFSFSVISGEIVTSETQLHENNLVFVKIDSGILSTTGVALDAPYEFQFLTTTTPSYTSIRRILLEVGGLIGDQYDDTIQLAILEASLDADVMTFSTITNSEMFQHARREYTTCLASLILLLNLGPSLKSKTLGDLSVQYDPSNIDNAIDRLKNCVNRWEDQLVAGGDAIGSRMPIGFVKGSRDPDRPIVARSFESATEPGIAQGVPAANTRVNPQWSRRYLRTWRKRSKFKNRW